MNRKIIAVDFDGTIVDSEFPRIIGAKKGAVDTLRALKREGHFLILWTCRFGDDLTDAVNWMLRNKVPFDCVNDHNPDNLKKYGGLGGKKVFADLYIDDKSISGPIDWDKLRSLLTAQGYLSLKITQGTSFVDQLKVLDRVQRLVDEVDILLKNFTNEKEKALALAYLDSYIQGELADLEELPKTEKL